MLKQMPPSDAPPRGHLMPMVFEEQAEQRADDQAHAAANERIDELVIDTGSVPLLKKNLKRIEDTFKVVVKFGLVVLEDVDKQWIEIQGRDEDRASAKNYVKALCSPGETFSQAYPSEILEILSSPLIHNRIEKQSNAVLLFSSTQATIQGEDNLAVTLAMSIIDDIIDNFLGTTDILPASPDATNTSGSNRLDTELRRLSSQHKELYDEEYYVEELTSLPPAVKRTMLKHYMYDPDPCKSTRDNDPRTDKDQTVPMQLATSHVGSSQPATVDLHPERKLKAVAPPSSSAGHAGAHSPNLDSDSLSLTLHLGTTASIKGSERPPMIDLNKVKGTDVKNNDPTEIEDDVDSPVNHPLINRNKGVINEAHRYALSRGYTGEEIACVQKDFGDLLSTSDFLKALVANRRLEAENKALSVSDLEASQIGKNASATRATAAQQTITSMAASEEAKPILLTNTRISPVSFTEQASGGLILDEDSSQNVGVAGKQPNDIQAHNQGPKSKKGKHVKGNQGKPEKKKKERKSRWSPVDPALTDNKDVAPSSPVRHTFEEILQSSPHVRGRKGEDNDGKAIPPAVMDYLHRLTRDYDEEDNHDIEEIRQRNAQRQAILRQLFKGDKLDEKEKEKDEGNTMDTDWTVAGRDGRHSFTSAQEQDARGGEKNNNKAKEQALPKNPTVSRLPVEKAGFSKETSANPPPVLSDSARMGVDELDDFSLPYTVNNQPAKGNHVRPLFPPPQHVNINRGIRPLMTDYNTEALAAPFIPPSQHNWQAQRQQSQPQAGPSSEARSRSKLRYIVIDGSNVAMTHGNHRIYSCKGIRICIDYFKRRGHKEITAFVPQWRTHAPRPDQPIRDQHMLEEMRKEGTLVFTPARRVPGKNIVCYDDKFILRLAQETEGIMVSNDNYRDLWREKREWRGLIEKRLLMFSFVGDIFMPPDDPLGRNGPNLDEFLRKSDSLEQYPGHDFSHQPHVQVPMQQYMQPNYNYDRGRGVLGPHPRNPGRYHVQQQHQGFHQGYRPRNPGVFDARPQNIHAGPHPPSLQPKVRDTGMTLWLKKQVQAIFPDDEKKLDEILQRYPCESSVNEIVEHMLE